MELELSTIHAQIKAIKETIFSDELDPYLLVSPCAYETAWLAMIPDTHQPSKPMFENCLNWVLINQNQHGFWGDTDSQGKTTIECLVATLACILALNRWKLGTLMIEKGLAFIHSSQAEKLLKEVIIIKDHCPRWFAIVFPAMVELVQEVDLKIELKQLLISDVFRKRQQILKTEQLVDAHDCPPLLSYLEALPSSHKIDEEVIVKNLCGAGSLFQSPSATASAFMSTGNEKCLSYLQSLAQRCPNGVPTTYPMDEELIKLWIINNVERLGLAEHFTSEIEHFLEQVYKSYNTSEELCTKPGSLVALQLHRDSLAFQLLRMHGYKVLPRSVCWFLYDEKIKNIIENNHEYFCSVMYNVLRATYVTFTGEYELQEAKSFSRKMLEKSILMGAGDAQMISFRKLIEHELGLPWMARLDHLEHRFWIEQNEANALWQGKTSSQRYSLNNLTFTQNYVFRQSIYKAELEELKRWSKDWGISDMGFGREKTTYCYFGIAASCSLPYDSDVRMFVAKSGILITVADDFYDTKGSLTELQTLTEAIRRWDGKVLSGEGRIIFDALDNVVSEMAMTYFKREGIDITNNLRDLWHETFQTWLIEATWIKTDYTPSMDEYIQVGMISIGAHTMVLPASCFLSPSLPSSKLRPVQYESITKMLMILDRFSNDIQSYKKEKDEGKVNSVLLYLENNSEVDMEESIAGLRKIVDKKKEELLEHVLMDGFTDLPKSCRQLHLSCFKVFQMFYNFSNKFDSDTEMVEDIKKAIYISPKIQPSNPPPLESKTKSPTIMKYHSGRSSKFYIKTSTLPMHQLSWTSSRISGNWKMTIPLKFNCCLV
ncbi:hypothetical protein UlMin_011820 [Ulmus minor]